MEVNGQLHALATLTPKERAPSIHWIGSWVDPRAGLDTVDTVVVRLKPHICNLAAITFLDAEALKFLS